MDRRLDATNNLILRSLPDADLELLSPDLAPVALARSQRLSHPGQPIEHVYFPTAGIVSVVGGSRADMPTEAGVIGREGVANLSALLGVDRTPAEVMVQVPGHALALPAETADTAMRRSPAFNEAVRHFVHAFLAQTTSTVMANAHATLSQRLARWLLMARDRTRDDTLPLTHDFLAMMLACRRPSVSVALKSFEARGWVALRRGSIQLLNRDQVIREAGPFYGSAEAELARAFAEH